MIFLKIVFFVIIWAVLWGGCICELYALEENNFELNDSFIIIALFTAPVFFIGIGIFYIFYKKHKGVK